VPLNLVGVCSGGPTAFSPSQSQSPNPNPIPIRNIEIEIVNGGGFTLNQSNWLAPPQWIVVVAGYLDLVFPRGGHLGNAGSRRLTID